MVRLVLLGLSLTFFVAPASADERVVYAGVFLHDVARLELRDGMVDVDFELWAKWRGELDCSRIRSCATGITARG